MNFNNNTLNLQFNKLNLNFGFRYTFIFILSFALNWYLFKLQNIALLSGIIATFYFITPNKSIKFRPLTKITYLYLNIILITFLGSLANVNLLLSLPLNLLVPFVIVCIFSNETNTNGYIFYYSLFIYMQFLGINLVMFNFLLVSTFIGLIIGYVFEEVIWSKNYKSIDSDIKGFKEYFATSLKCNYIKLRDGLNLDLLTSRFAVRLSIATAFSFIFWKYLNLPKWYWIPISTCFTLVPICSEINSRALRRIQGTTIGAIIFLICSFFVKDMFTYVILSVLSAILMLAYLPHNRQAESFIFSTYMALSFSIISLSSIAATTYRVLYVLIGVFIAMIFNKLVLPNKQKIYSD